MSEFSENSPFSIPSWDGSVEALQKMWAKQPAPVGNDDESDTESAREYLTAAMRSLESLITSHKDHELIEVYLLVEEALDELE